MIPIPLTVRLKTADMDRHVERDLRDLSFRTVAPGGYASATFSLDRPLTIDPLEIAYYGQVFIYDRRDGTIVWEGRLEDPGRTAGPDGQVWSLAAVGPSAHAQDKVVPRIWVDRSLDRWLRSRFSLRNGRVDRMPSDADDEEPSLRLVAQEGQSYAVGTNAGIIVDAMYRAIYDCGQKLGRVRMDVVDAITSSALENRITTRPGPGGAGTNVHAITWSPGPTAMFGSRGGANAIPSGDDVADLRIVIVSGSETATANRWADLTGIAVVALKKDINGNDLTSGADNTNNYVFAHEVVIDMIGRGDLNMYDAATASIDTSSTVQIDELAFPSGVTPAEVLDSLMDLEPAFYWAAWESQANGKYRFEWKTWPSTIRYEAGIVDGFDSPGSAEGLFNEALIAYTDWVGRERTALSTSSVTDLTNAGLTRTYHADLTDQSNSLANAQRVGSQALTEHATPPNAGTLTIARPIIDNDLGMMIQPWEILPGFLIRVRGVRANRDSLNATSRDGVTVFKIASVEYDTTSAAATLELDAYSQTVARALVALKNDPLRAARRRRR
jgi:hypothetical protein